MYRRIQIILKMFIPVHVLKLSKENGEYSLFLCLSQDEKTFLNGTLNIKYEKKNSNRNAACLCLASHPKRTIGSLAAFTCTHLKVSTSEVKVKQGDIPTTKRDQHKSAHILLGR